MKKHGAIAVLLTACLLLGGCNLVDGGHNASQDSSRDTSDASSGPWSSSDPSVTTSRAGGDTAETSSRLGTSSLPAESGSSSGNLPPAGSEPESGGSSNTLDDMFAAAKASYEADLVHPLGAGEEAFPLYIRILAGDAVEFVAEVQYYHKIFGTCYYDTLDPAYIEYTETMDYESYLSARTYRIKWEAGRYQVTDRDWQMDYSDLPPAGFTKVYGQLSEKQRDICRFEGDILKLSYDRGQSWIYTPYTKSLLLSRGDSYDGRAHLQDGCSFMRDGLSAFVYGGNAYIEAPVTIAVTYDQGQSFTEVRLPEPIQARDFFIGFLPDANHGYGPESFGWLAIGRDRLMSMEGRSVYFTHDGGRSWVNSHSLDDQFSTLLSGAAFASEQVGFLCFTSIGGDSSWILRTVDGGRSWEDFQLPLPEDLDENDYSIALAPVFEGNQGVFELRPGENRRARFLSDDGGRTWR
ncbi:MAG: hypothetical protein HFE86_04645, partial [Clostridiales bacterium]|nr:hypothetical protein [Clostridiales bacterium]